MGFTVAFSSIGRRVELAMIFREELQRAGGGRLLGFDMDPTASGSGFVDEFFQVPACSDPAYKNVLLELCEENAVDLIIPLIDTELATWAAFRQEMLRQGTMVMVSDAQTIGLCADKYRFGEHLAARDIATPELVKSFREVGPNDELVVKPRGGSSSLGISYVTAAELALAWPSADEWVVQRRVRGREYSVDAFVDPGGSVRSACVREQLEMRAGETSKGRSGGPAQVKDAAIAAVQSMPGAFGLLHMDLIVDGASGKPVVLEMNARFPGGYPLSHRAGSPAVRWLIELAKGESPDYSSGGVMREVFMARYELGSYTYSGTA